MPGLALQPFDLGPVRLRNRVVVGAHGTNFPSDGMPTDRYVAYLRARAEGGVAMVVTEGTHVHPTSGGPHMIALWRPGAEAALAPLVDAVHGGGAAAVCQIMHVGRQTEAAMLGRPAVAPSARPDPAHACTPHALTRREVRELVDAFARSAEVARRAGFDGVEVHAAHGYLIEQFLSPWSNGRDDEYGGTPEGRLRFARDVLRAVLDRVGGDLVVGARLGVVEDVAGGLDRAASLEIAATLASEGLSYVSATSGLHCTPLETVPPAGSPLVPLAADAAAFRAAVGCPVVASHRIKTLAAADAVLESGAADLVSMVRANLADPELVRKVIDGRRDEVRECIGCVQACRGQLVAGLPIGCLVNPDAGRESEPRPEATAPRRVAVVGGGVAGMQAAVTAARRGHDVVLYERGDRLGGAFRLAGELPERHELLTFPAWLEGELHRRGVEVVLGTEPSAAELAGADAVVAAVGAEHPEPDRGALPGADVPVVGLHGALTAPPPRTAVVLDRGDHRNVALLLARRFRDAGATTVVVLDAGPVAARLDQLTALWLKRDLDDRIQLVDSAADLDVRGTSATWSSPAGPGRLDGVDLVVVLDPPVARRWDGDERAVLVGDGAAPGGAVEAVAHAHTVALGL